MGTGNITNVLGRNTLSTVGKVQLGLQDRGVRCELHLELTNLVYHRTKLVVEALCVLLLDLGPLLPYLATDLTLLVGPVLQNLVTTVGTLDTVKVGLTINRVNT